MTLYKAAVVLGKGQELFPGGVPPIQSFLNILVVILCNKPYHLLKKVLLAVKVLVYGGLANFCLLGNLSHLGPMVAGLSEHCHGSLDYLFSSFLPDSCHQSITSSDSSFLRILALVFWDMSSRMVYMTGTTTRVRTVERINPPITTLPSGAINSAPSPIPRVIGIRPRIVVRLVIRIGLSLMGPAVSIASLLSMPCFLNVLI